MSKESYARGFVKAAAAAGVDPVALAKYAANYEPIIRDGKARVDNDTGAYSGLPAPNGDISWLNSTEPVAVDVPGGSIRLPNGAASLTNNSHLVSYTPKGQPPRLIPTWWEGGGRNARRKDGVRISYPIRDERIKTLLENLATGKTKKLPSK